MKTLLIYFAKLVKKGKGILHETNVGKHLRPVPSFWALIPLRVEDSFKKNDNKAD